MMNKEVLPSHSVRLFFYQQHKKIVHVGEGGIGIPTKFSIVMIIDN